MGAKEYHARRALSSSGIKELIKSPAHFLYWQANGSLDPHAAPFRVGGAFHSLLLDTEPRIEIFTGAKSLNSKAGEICLAAHPDSWVVTEEEWKTVEGMAGEIQRKSSLVKLLRDSHREQEFYWSEDGLSCKAMLDMVHPKAIFDLKTTSDPASSFMWSARKYRYDIQAAWYTRALVTTGASPRPFYFVVVEKNPPHGIMTFEINEQTMALANEEIDRMLALYGECMAGKAWPSYTNEIQSIGWKHHE